LTLGRVLALTLQNYIRINPLTIC